MLKETATGGNRSRIRQNAGGLGGKTTRILANAATALNSAACEIYHVYNPSGLHVEQS